MAAHDRETVALSSGQLVVVTEIIRQSTLWGEKPGRARPPAPTRLTVRAGAATVARVRLAVGEVVVYAAYGVGRVVARERRPVHGAEQEVVVVELADGLSVLLPIERAREQLRLPVSAAGVRRIQERLRQDRVPSLDAWPKRRQQTRAKLTSGDPLELAEVVRDGARHKQALAAKGSAQLSSGEKVLYEKARQLLSAEIGVACALDPAQADAWIDEQITAPARSH